MKALLEDDAVLAKKVMKADDAIDDMIIDVEDKCILLIAKQQPIAHDLRVIATGFKISTDIERIGDHAFDIAKTAASVKEPLNPDCKRWIEELGNCASTMVRRAVKARRDKSVQEADEVRKMDKQMDEVFEHTFYALSDFVTKEGARQKGATFYTLHRALPRAHRRPRRQHRRMGHLPRDGRAHPSEEEPPDLIGLSGPPCFRARRSFCVRRAMKQG